MHNSDICINIQKLQNIPKLQNIQSIQKILNMNYAICTHYEIKFGVVEMVRFSRTKKETFETV